MPKLVLQVPDTTEGVLRPIVFDISRQLLDVTGLDAATRIYYPGDVETDKQPGSSITDAPEINNLPFNNKVTVTVDEDYEADRIMSTAVYKPENLYVFRDDRIETSIKPAYSSTEVTLNFRFRAADKTSAIRWRDGVKNRVSMGQSERIHSVKYHYLIPEEFLVILKELHRMREAVDGYGETYEEYFRANATQRASELVNLNGQQKAWGISEGQMRIVGWFDFTGMPEQGSKEDDGDTWTIAFSYKFKYDKPIACVMNYPLVVHNQLVGRNFRPAATDQPDRVDAHKRSYTLSAGNFQMFEKGQGFVGANNQSGIAVPEFDEFIPGDIVNNTIRVFTAMCTIGGDNPRLLMNIGEIGDWAVDPDVIEYLKSEAMYLSTPMRSLLVVTLYKNTDLLGADNVVVDADLNVLSTIDLSLRNYYHVRLGLLTDWSLVDVRVLDRAREHGPALIKLLDAVDPSLQEKGLLPRLIGDSYVSRADLNRAIAEMNRAILSKGDGQTYQWHTVMSLIIQSNRQN